jgi:hypothetical protein
MLNLLLKLQQDISLLALKEIREWVQFLLVLIGGTITLQTYVGNQRQRRLENSLRLIDLFQKSIQSGDIEEWRKIFLGSSEPTGVRHGHFLDSQNQERLFADLFSEGAPDNGAIERIAEQFDLISYEVLNKTVNLRLIYFHLGQLMDTTYDWLQMSQNPSNSSSFISEYFPYFDKMYRKNQEKFKNWSRKTYAHIE